MKKAAILVLIVICITLSPCQTENGGKTRLQNDSIGCVINGREIHFVPESTKKEWIEPLAKLLANVLLPCYENEDLVGYKAAVDPDAPAIEKGYQCGLLDITQDGTPELLVLPYGYFGSSGTETYYIYDIYSGQYLGSIDGGNGGSWCEIYYTETDEIKLVGQYWLRYGWDERERFINTIAFDAEAGEYAQKSYLRTFHLINGEQTNIEDKDPEDMFYTATWVETYPKTLYFVNGEVVYLDDYYAEYDWFTQNCVRIHETELKLFGWDDVSEDGDDYVTRGRKMTEALVSSEQEFIDFKQ